MVMKAVHEHLINMDKNSIDIYHVCESDNIANEELVKFIILNTDKITHREILLTIKRKLVPELKKNTKLMHSFTL